MVFPVPSAEAVAAVVASWVVLVENGAKEQGLQLFFQGKKIVDSLKQNPCLSI